MLYVVKKMLNFNSIKVRLKLLISWKFVLIVPYFNSIKVRLKLCVLGFYLKCGNNFNSIKVRLKQKRPPSKEPPAANFNSIKVRLKLIKVLIYALTLIFQFHKGTIKTDLSHRHMFTAKVFQFHKGTIKTWWFWICCALILDISIP